jgi:hypothetical protein
MIKIFSYPNEDVYEWEQAQHFLDFKRELVQVEGHRVNSYDELVQLASREEYRNRDYIEVMLLPTIVGG